ncbi:MAG: hypothetical protein ACFFC7_07875 [Candidatus Hermodarchaeota archaeon]
MNHHYFALLFAQNEFTRFFDVLFHSPTLLYTIFLSTLLTLTVLIIWIKKAHSRLNLFIMSALLISAVANLLREVIFTCFVFSLSETQSGMDESIIGVYSSESTLQFGIIILGIILGMVLLVLIFSLKKLKYQPESFWKKKMGFVVYIFGFIGFFILFMFSFFELAFLLVVPSMIGLFLTLQTNRDRIIEEIIRRIEIKIQERRLELKWNQIYRAAEKVIDHKEQEKELNYEEVEDYTSRAFQLIEIWQKESESFR